MILLQVEPPSASKNAPARAALDAAGELRVGLAAMLQLYVVNVACEQLVGSPEYECIAIVDREAEAGDRTIWVGCCYRCWPAAEADCKGRTRVRGPGVMREV